MKLNTEDYVIITITLLFFIIKLFNVFGIGDTLISTGTSTFSSNREVSVNNLACSATATQIKGTVFQDFNYDGIYNVGSDYLGLKGMAVSATDSLGNTLITETDVNGDYIFLGLTTNRTYRIAFIFPDSLSWAKPTFYGIDNGTTIQFIKAGNCANLGVSNPADYCEENPLIAIPCYVNGDPLGGGTSGTGDWMVFFRNDNQGQVGSGGYTPPEIYVDGQVIGATWGMAYHRQTANVLAGAVMKRHAGFGQNGTGAIYKIDNTGTPSLFVDLNTYANVNTGLDTRGTTNNILPITSTAVSRDINAFQAVGKVGLGDVELSDDGEYLYAINLNDRTLIKAYVGNSLTVPATVDTFGIATAIETLLVGNPIACGIAADYRPWALKYHNGLLYIGVVCSAETSQTASDLHAYVLSFDPFNPGAGFSEVIDMAMDYAREPVFQSDNVTQTIAGTWRPWALSYTDATILSWNGGGHPSPILSDIEIDDDGSMILGFLDRFGMESGYRQLSTDLSDGDANHQGMSGGDVIRFCRINGSLVQEGGAGCGFNTSPLWINPGTFVPQGEFYAEEEYFTTITNPSHGHPETSLGGLALKPGSGEIVATVYDPFTLRSGGVAWWDNTNGSSNKEYELYESVNASSPDGTFGKAAGFGDLELMCAAAPIEIGNFIWADEDGDGVQDAGELGLEGIRMELYDNAGNLLAFDTTNNLGQYYFSGNNIDDANWLTTNDTLNINTTYYIIAGGNGQFSNDRITLNSTDYSLTTDSTSLGTNRYAIDSDGTIAIGIDPDFDNEPYVQITTGNVGEVDHTFDFGFRPIPYDYGDLPDIANGTTGINDYETYDSTGGPSHQIIVGLFLGDTVDLDSDGFPHAAAFGDDNDGLDDEDGVTILPKLNAIPGGTIRLPISVTNTTGDTAYIEVWIDWNGDGDFNITNELVGDLKDNKDGVFPEYLTIPIPTSATKGSLLGFRIRLSNTDNMTPYGRINSGEVEDYLLGIECEQVCLPIQVNIEKE